MSSGDVKKVSLGDIQVNLEKQNQEFFEAYHARLVLKEQILEFNQLLEKQAEIMHQVAEIDSISLSNGSQILPMPQDIADYAPEQTRTSLKTNYMHHSMYAGLPAFTNGGSSLHPNMQNSVEMSAHARRLNGSSHMLLGQNSYMGMVLDLNGEIMKQETGFADTSSFVYGANVTILEMPIGNPSIPSLSGTGSNLQTLDESTLDLDTSSFGYLGQFPRNFSLSDLTANFSSSDKMESYSGSPFVEADMDNLFDVEH